LKAEFLNIYYEGRLRPLGQAAMANIHRAIRLGSWAAPIVNALQGLRLVRWALEKTGRIDRRRSMPRLHYNHFRRWFGWHVRQQRKKERENPGDKRPRTCVVLLDDCFTTFFEPHIGQAAVHVLEHLSCRVALAGLVCCCRPMISKGYL